MKPLIFTPENRPAIHLLSGGNASDRASQVLVAEATSHYLVITSSEALALRGEFKFESESYSFHKVEEQKVEGLYYTQIKLKENQGKDLYRKFLVRLPPHELSEWILGEMVGPEDLDKADLRQVNNYFEQTAPVGAIADGLSRFLIFLYQRPWLSVLLIILMSVFPALHIKNLRMDPSLDRVLVKDSPEMKIYNESIKLFGSDQSALLFIEDPDIFNKDKLKVLRSLAWDLQKWPEIEKVHSVFTSTFIRDQEETLYTEPMLQSLDGDMDFLLAKIQKDPILHGRLIDVPKKILIFNLQIDKDYKDKAAVAKKLNEKIAPIKGEFKKFYQTGEAIMTLFNQEEMVLGPKIFLPLISLILFIGFFFFIKSLDAFVITVAGTIMSIFWSYGIMTAFDIPIQVMIVLIPGITLTLSATEIVHLISSYKTGIKRGLTKENAIDFMCRDIGKAVFLTFTSTSLGFLSIRFSEIQVLEEFAIVAFMALVFDFLMTLLYLPFHLRVFSHKETEGENLSEKMKPELPMFQKLRNKFHRIYLQSFFSKKALYIVMAFVAIHLFFARTVRMDNDSTEMIAPYTDIKKGLNYFEKNIGGMKGIHLVIESKDSLLEPDNLEMIWKIHNQIKTFPEVKDVQSIAGVLSLMNKEMRSGSEEDYKVPQSKNLISQYMLTLSRDDVDPYLTPDKKRANIRLSHDVSSSVATEEFVKRMHLSAQKIISEHAALSGSNFKSYLTSRNILNIQAGNTIIKSQAYSLLTMALVIIVLVGIFFRSLRVGTISLIPNIIPIIGLFGVMGLFDVPLNIGTCVVAAVTIGIAADDTIHLFSRYFKDRQVDSNPFSTGRESINEELVPIFTTSLTLSLSFCTFVISKIIPVLEFGLLSAYVLFLAIISDLYIGPWVLTYFDLKKMKGKQQFFAYLLGRGALRKGRPLAELSFLELFTLMRAGSFSTIGPKGYQPNTENWEVLINGNLQDHREGEALTKPDSTTQDNALYFSISKEKLRHLSPRIFEKFCHNLKD